MRHIRRLVLAVVAALLAVAVAGATPASATTLCTAGTLTAPCTTGHPGGAFTLTSTNLAFALHGGGVFTCTDTSLSGAAPATSATTLSFPVTLSQTGCALLGVIPVTLTVPTACRPDGATPIRLNVMWNQASAPQAAVALTIPSGCSITYDVPILACTVTIAGPQTIGNGTSGTGGMGWTDGSATSASTLDVSGTVATLQSSGGGVGCPTAGVHTSTQSGAFTVTAPTPAPGMTVIS